jgi:hypothetical protein
LTYLFGHRPEAGDHLRFGAEVCLLVSHGRPNAAWAAVGAPSIHDDRQHTGGSQSQGWWESSELSDRTDTPVKRALSPSAGTGAVFSWRSV